MAMPVPLPDRDGELELHRRLLAGDDPTAVRDFIAAYLDQLTHWLERANSVQAQDLCGDAAERAILSTLKNPASYDPGRQTLIAYLRMAATMDLRTLLAREAKYRERHVSMNDVEDSPKAGKYLGCHDDPSLPMQLREEAQARMQAIPASLLEGLTEIEKRVYELLMQGARKREEFAAACEVTDLSVEEQAKEVNRVKDRLKRRLKRAGGSP